MVSCGARVTALDLDRAALSRVQKKIRCDILVADLLECETAVRRIESRIAEKGAFDLLAHGAEEHQADIFFPTSWDDTC